MTQPLAELYAALIKTHTGEIEGILNNIIRMLSSLQIIREFCSGSAMKIDY